MQFGDDYLPYLGAFSTLYERKSAEKIASSLLSNQCVYYLERMEQRQLLNNGDDSQQQKQPREKGMFMYCNSLKSWTFSLLPL